MAICGRALLVWLLYIVLGSVVVLKWLFLSEQLPFIERVSF
jgi:hypothetical protein